MPTTAPCIKPTQNLLRSKLKNLILLQALACAFPAAWATDGKIQDPVLETVEVKAERNDKFSTWLTPEKNATATTYQVGKEGFEAFGAAGGANAYSLASGIPSVKVQTIDPYGLSNVFGGNKGLKVRGIAAWHGANGTVDGLNLGTGPGAGYLSMFDYENIAGASMVQGPVPPDRINTFTASGALDTQLLWPQATSGNTFSASAGSFNYQRLFAKLSTGEIAGNTKLAISASDTSSDLWRGPGNQKRGNYLAAVDSQLGDLNIRVMAAKSDTDQNNFRPLTTFAQASDLDRYQYFSYDRSPASSSRNNYYQYNRQSFTETAYIGEATYRLTPMSSITVKAYTQNENGWNMSAGSNTTNVTKSLMDHDTYGVIAEFNTSIAETAIKFGYSQMTVEPPSPQYAQKNYTANATGLIFTTGTNASPTQGWKLLSKITDQHQFQNLYAMATHQFDDLKIQGGLRYVHETMPSMAEYNKVGVGDVGYDAAIKASSGVLVSVKGPSISEVLPYIGSSYALNEKTDLRASLGRNYGFASFDVWNSTIVNTIIGNSTSYNAATQAKAQAVWNTLKPELDDVLDLSIRRKFNNGYIEPVIYYGRIRNKSINTSTTINGTTQTFSQNIGNGHMEGAQLNWGWMPSSAITLFGSASINKAIVTEDVAGLSSIKGNQFPDTPRVMANVGINWQVNNISITPVAQYMGSRYDDIYHTNRIPSYYTLNLDIGYSDKSTWGKTDYTLSILNAFDRRYISQINAPDLPTSGGTMNYYPGAPRTLMAKVAVSF
jgi:iron complex outermembrane receptor protein